MENERAIEELMERPYFLSRDAHALGVSSSLLSYYDERGVIEKLEKGLYKGANVDHDYLPIQYEDLIYSTLSIPDSVICLISATSIYDITEEMMRSFWIAIPNGRKAPVRKHIRAVRFRDMELGRTTVKYGDIEVPIFDRERSVVDTIKMLSRETGLKTLRMYLDGDGFKPDINKLSDYADIRGVKKIHYYLEALLV